MAIQLRDARAEDGAAVAAIYAHYVEATVITFELEPPDAGEMAARITRALQSHTWIVAEDPDGQLLGYAYCAPFRGRPAYDWSAETAIYLDPGRRRGGLGRRLYEELLARMERLGLRLAVAGVTLPNPESEGFHAALGFEPVGTFHAVGWKHDAWHDVAFFEKRLGPGSDQPPGPSPVARG